MDLSEDEDDFQSADEDGFGFEQKVSTIRKDDKLDMKQLSKSDVHSEKQNDAPRPRESKSTGIKTLDSCRLDSKLKAKIKNVPDKSPSEPVQTKVPIKIPDDDEEEEEEALVERIRERNLMIARKFSVEIAKNNKKSLPIPVKGAPSIGFKVDTDIEYPTLPDSDLKSSLPPAPPPTPALSSSFNSDDPIGANKYGLRAQSKASKSKVSEVSAKDSTSEQARIALDRLSEKLSSSEKNLFEKVADDIKKVSIKAEHPTSESTTSSGLPIISDIGNTFGGWNWNSATRLLASASQVTSQVSSVLDSVVSATQLVQQSAEPQQQDAQTTSDSPSQSVRHDKQSTGSNKASMSATDANSNDALVDLTLNAMESLGKKAFGVMTERDESGSLQIKGLGRPWEHLLNLKKAQHQSQEQNSLPDYRDSVEASTSDTKFVRDEQKTSLKNRKKHSPYSDDDNLD